MEPVTAENTPVQEPVAQAPAPEQAPAPAASVETSIPKHRFDELASQLRDVKEDMRTKDDIIHDLSGQLKQNSQPAQTANGLTAESLGIDEQTFDALKQISAQETQKLEVKYRGFIGKLATDNETNRLFIDKGKDAKKYLPRMQELQKEHVQTTGSHLPLDLAYRLARADEFEKKLANTQPQPGVQQNPAVAVVPPVQQQVVNQQAPNPAPVQSLPAQNEAEINDKALEDMEAQMDQQYPGQAL